MKIQGCLVAFLLILMTPTWVMATDKAKEQRWAEQVVDSLMDGEDTMLKAGDHEFLGLYMEASEDSHKGAIVVHGIGIHPNWEQVVKPLRIGLPDHGWHTLSIQVPVLHNDAEGADYAPLMKDVPARIQASIDYLNEKGVKDVVIVAHSLGAAMSSYYLANTPDTPVKAYVGIGMNGTTKIDDMNNAVSLQKMKLPVLDLYGSNDLEGIIKSADKRAEGAKENKGFSQQKVEGADHFFNDKDDELVDVVASWLNKTMSASSDK